MCRFGEQPDEDPSEYIKSFLKICDPQKHNGVSSGAKKLMLLPFCIKNKANIWYYSLPKEMITIWDEMASTILAKYLPPVKVSKF